MIDDALNLIKEELTQFLDVNGDGIGPVSLDNIADLEKDTFDTSGCIIISLVNIEEESALKNIKAQRRNQFTGNLEYLNPPVFLNLYLLFSSVPTSTGADKYKNALKSLGLVIRFFQNKKTFTLNNALRYDIDTSTELEKNLENLKIIMDLYTLTFEQINHLWGSLGGKQVPFVMYKARLVEIKDEQIQKGGSVITEIHSNETIN